MASIKRRRIIDAGPSDGFGQRPSQDRRRRGKHAGPSAGFGQRETHNRRYRRVYAISPEWIRFWSSYRASGNGHGRIDASPADGSRSCLYRLRGGGRFHAGAPNRERLRRAHLRFPWNVNAGTANGIRHRSNLRGRRCVHAGTPNRQRHREHGRGRLHPPADQPDHADSVADYAAARMLTTMRRYRVARKSKERTLLQVRSPAILATHVLYMRLSYDG